MPSTRYRAWFDAIRDKRRVCYVYQGKLHEGCPHALGLDKDGAEKVLICRAIPGGSQPQWRYLLVAETTIAGPANGPWLEDSDRKRRNSGIAEVDIDADRTAEQRFKWPVAKKARPEKKTGAKKKKPRTR